jgi:hypothetical protein
MRAVLHIMVAGALFAASACHAPRAAYYNRGAPESLLDVSSEVVNLPIATPAQVNELSSWLNSDQPTRAELYCNDTNLDCQNAVEVLELFAVPFIRIPSAESTATLVYERTLARDCDQRYIDNRSNPYNLNHPAFGCALAGNIVQHVSDKKQFVKPGLLGLRDAKKAVQNVEQYRAAPEGQQQYGITNNALTENFSTEGQ